MSKHAYCTYFDSAYASRGRVLIETLREQGDNCTAFVLALDDVAKEEVASWSDLNVRLVSLQELEETYPHLLEARGNRSRMEYLFTLTPWLTLWTLDQVPEGAWATYLDADMAFFGPTEPLYVAAADGSVMIVEHRFTWEQGWRRKYGRFNVAWVGFRNDAPGRDCLEWWAQSCHEWCYDEVSEGRFADQGFLDSFPALFERVVILKHPGADLAPWNLRRHDVTWDGQQVEVDGCPLVFFHFHGLRSEGRRYRFKHVPYLAKTTQAVREGIYRPYCEALARRSGGSPSVPVLQRRPTLLSSLRAGRAGLLRWVGDLRGNYVDVDLDPDLIAPR